MSRTTFIRIALTTAVIGLLGVGVGRVTATQASATRRISTAAPAASTTTTVGGSTTTTTVPSSVTIVDSHVHVPHGERRKVATGPGHVLLKLLIETQCLAGNSTVSESDGFPIDPLQQYFSTDLKSGESLYVYAPFIDCELAVLAD
jgi:hypothetical protein